jgi:hypothetical protein
MMARRDRKLVSRVVSLACLGALAACAAVDQPAASNKSGLTIDFVWTKPGAAPPPPLEPSQQQVPASVVLRWNPQDYSGGEIAAIAGQQCITFDRRAQAVGQPSTVHGLQVERYDCVTMTGQIQVHPSIVMSPGGSG